MPRRLLTLVPFALAASLAGCGGEDLGHMLPVHPTSGKVTWKGEPVRDAFVRFHPVDPQTIALPPGETGPAIVLTTATEADGRFVMSSYYADDGVPAGEYVVTVAARPSPGEVDESGNAEERPAGEGDSESTASSPKKPAKPTFARLYADPAASPLKATVKPGEANQFTFELDAVDAKAARPKAARAVD